MPKLSEIQGKKTVKLSEINQIESPQSSNSNYPAAASMGGLPGLMLQRGSDLSKGVTPQDIPYIAAKPVSQAFAGIPEFLAKRPIAGPVEGFNTRNSIFPEPATEAGRKAGDELGLYASFLPAIEGLQSIVAPAAKTAAKGTANRLMNSVLKPTIKDLQRNPQLGYEAAKAGLTGTRKQISEKAGNLITQSEEKLQAILDKSKGNVPLQRIAESLDELKLDFQKVGDDASIKAIEDVQNGLKSTLAKQSVTKEATDALGVTYKTVGEELIPEIPVQKANELKRAIYRTLKDSQYGSSEVPAKTMAKKAAAGKLKRGIENAIPDQPIAGINKQMGLAGKVGSLAERAGNLASRNNMAGLIDTGLFAGSMGTGNPSLWSTLAMKKAAGSSFAKSKLAELLAKFAG